MPMPQQILLDEGDDHPAAEQTGEPDRTLDLTLLPGGEGNSGEEPQPLSDKEKVELYLDAFALCFNNGRRWLDP